MGGKSYFHRGEKAPLLGETIPEHFAAVAARFSACEAVVSVPQGRRLTYGALAAEADRLARGLLAAGFAKGDRIGIWSTNNLEWVVLQLATARIGAILVNINPGTVAGNLLLPRSVPRCRGFSPFPCKVA